MNQERAVKMRLTVNIRRRFSIKKVEETGVIKSDMMGIVFS